MYRESVQHICNVGYHMSDPYHGVILCEPVHAQQKPCIPIITAIHTMADHAIRLKHLHMPGPIINMQCSDSCPLTQWDHSYEDVWAESVSLMRCHGHVDHGAVDQLQSQYRWCESLYFIWLCHMATLMCVFVCEECVCCLCEKSVCIVYVKRVCVLVVYTT